MRALRSIPAILLILTGAVVPGTAATASSVLCAAPSFARTTDGRATQSREPDLGQTPT